MRLLFVLVLVLCTNTTLSSSSSSSSQQQPFQPFTPGSLSVIRIGTTTLESTATTAFPVFIDEFDGSSGVLLQSIPFPSTSIQALSDADPLTLHPLTLTTNDHLEGDLERSNEGCYLSVLGYGIEQGNSTASATKLLVAGLVNGNASSIDTSTALNFTGLGYSRADGCVRSPLQSPGIGQNNVNADIFMLAGQSASCSLQLVKQNTTNLLNGTLITDGFAARGISIAGEDPSRYELYVGGGKIIRKIGTNGLANLGGYTVGIPTITGGTDFGAGWEFANDTLAYVIDKDDNYTDHQGGLHSVHVYTCKDGNGSGAERRQRRRRRLGGESGSSDQANIIHDTPYTDSTKCPEGGVWSRVGQSTNFSYPCILSPQGIKKDVWFLAGDFEVRGSQALPIFYLTTDEVVGQSAVYKLDTSTGDCTLFVGPQPNIVYRGLAMSPTSTACSPPSPSLSPSPSPSATSSPSPSPSSSSSPSVTASTSASYSPTPSTSAVNPANNNNNAAGDTSSSAGPVAAGISFGVLFALLIVGGGVGRVAWTRGYLSPSQKDAMRSMAMKLRNLPGSFGRGNRGSSVNGDMSTSIGGDGVDSGGGGSRGSSDSSRLLPHHLTSSSSSSASSSTNSTSPNRDISDARIRSLSNLNSSSPSSAAVAAIASPLTTRFAGYGTLPK